MLGLPAVHDGDDDGQDGGKPAEEVAGIDLVLVLRILVGSREHVQEQTEIVHTRDVLKNTTIILETLQRMHFNTSKQNIPPQTL